MDEWLHANSKAVQTQYDTSKITCVVLCCACAPNVWNSFRCVIRMFFSSLTFLFRFWLKKTEAKCNAIHNRTGFKGGPFDVETVFDFNTLLSFVVWNWCWKVSTLCFWWRLESTMYTKFAKDNIKVENVFGCVSIFWFRISCVLFR